MDIFIIVVVPGLLLLASNFSLVLAVMMGRVHSANSRSRPPSTVVSELTTFGKLKELIKNNKEQYSIHDKMFNEIQRSVQDKIFNDQQPAVLTNNVRTEIENVENGHVTATEGPPEATSCKSWSKKTWECNLVITMIAMATSYLILVTPSLVYILIISGIPVEHCIKSPNHYSLEHVSICLLLVERLLHPVFLTCLMPTFRMELWHMIRRIITLQKNRGINHHVYQ